MDMFEESESLPEYKRNSAPDQSVKVTRKVTFPAWIGKREWLLKMEEYIESNLERQYQARVKGLDPTKFRDRMLADTLRNDLRLEVKVMAAGNVERRGPLAAVLAELDQLSDIESITMSNGSISSRAPRIDLRLQKEHAYLDPAVLEVTGDDKQWVSGVFTDLRGDLQKAVPRWVHLIRPIVLFPLFGSFLSLAIWTIVALTSDSERLLAGSPAAIANFFLITFSIAGFVCIAISGTFKSIARNWLPRLDVLDQGDTARAIRSFKLLAGTIGVVSGLLGIAAALF